MSPSETEQVKLLANSLDRCATTCFTVGVATPVAGYAYNIANFGASLDPFRLLLAIMAWLIAGVGLHYLARRVLKGLDR